MSMKHIGLILAQDLSVDTDLHLQELKALCATIDIEVPFVVTQKMRARKPGLLGQGKLSEIKLAMDERVTHIITLQTLSPNDRTLLAEYFPNQIIMDKFEVVVTIFEKRASSTLSNLQVKLLRLQMEYANLAGSYESYSKQGGGGVSRGQGEQQLQIDRRHLSRRMIEVRNKIEKEHKKNEMMTQRRQKNSVFTVSLVGYTNAGKSTLLNSLLSLSKASKVNKMVESKNQVFSSLDTATRRIEIPFYAPFLLIDTVGLIHECPAELVEAFKTTMGSLDEADLVIALIDASRQDTQAQLETILSYAPTLDEDKLLVVFNKCDLNPLDTNHLCISAKNGDSVMQLVEIIDDRQTHDYILVKGECDESEVGQLFQENIDCVITKLIKGTDSIYCEAKIAPHRKDLMAILVTQNTSIRS
jgi:GTPase